MNGTMYAAARDITPKVMYINTKMFKDAGGNSFRKIGRWMTLSRWQSTDQGFRCRCTVGLLLEEPTDQTFAMIAAFGGKLYSEDGKASVFYRPQDPWEAVQFMYDLCNTYKGMSHCNAGCSSSAQRVCSFMAKKGCHADWCPVHCF